MLVVIAAAKIALVVYLAAGVTIIGAAYYRRRRSGVTPWRPPNSRILGYDAPAVEIEWPAPTHGSIGEPPTPGLCQRRTERDDAGVDPVA